MSKYSFYYDESEHSRKINHNTITAENYFDSFIAVVVGYLTNNQADLYERCTAFESKYQHRQCNGELKSTTIKQIQLKSGFASLNADNLSLLEDFLTLFDERILVYYAVTSKIEYIIRQLFEGYENSLFLDMDAMKYSITKAIVLYQPCDIMAGLYKTSGELVTLMKNFFTAQIEKDKANETLKQKEIEQFGLILLLLDDVSTIRTIDWNYDIAFVGFKKLLDEKGINDYSLTIDKEGKNGNTLKAATRVGLNEVSEADSLSSCGIRMADMLAGVISRLLKALHSALKYASPEEMVNKKILDKSWFAVNERQLALYKKMHQVAIELNKAWHKTFAGIYSDDLIVFIALLGFMNHFESAEDIRKDLDMQGEYFNAYCCESLADYYKRMRNKLPIEHIAPQEKDFYYDKWGAKCYSDTDRQPMLKIQDGSTTYNVLNVGFDKRKLPMATIQDSEKATCYRLPTDLTEWAMSVVGLASFGSNIFPSEVVFSKIKGRCYADIL